jgi:nuclear factor erythroid 2, invertebrate
LSFLEKSQNFLRYFLNILNFFYTRRFLIKMMNYSNCVSHVTHLDDNFLIFSPSFTLLGMYTMRMLDQNGTNSSAAQLNQALLGNHMQTNLSSSGIGSSASSSHQHASGDRLDASSDSAVSSMGSERVASLSDGEWNEAGSDSAQEYHS